MIVILGTFVGALLVLAGGWVVVLELRGRASRLVDGSQRERVRVASGTGDDVAGVLEALAKFRGPLLAIVAGGAMIVALAWIEKDVASIPSTPTTTIVTTSVAPAAATTTTAGAGG
jgi:hypothetical protein